MFPVSGIFLRLYDQCTYAWKLKIDEKTVIGDQATSDSSHGAKTASLAD